MTRLPTSLRRNDYLLALVLAVLTFALFWPLHTAQFMSYDDDGYVVDCRQVKTGLTLDTSIWAFKTGLMSNWHPLTWISYQLDVSLFGVNAGPMHVENVLLHSISSALLLLAAIRLTHCRMASAWVAAAFAWHPLRAESVAWIAERKDVLCAVWFMACLVIYSAYVSRPSWARYGLLAACMTLGLLAKPMIVTLPAVLILLDYWPLQRDSLDSLLPTRPYFKTALAALVVEKIPLVLLSAADSVATVVAQSASHSVASVSGMPLKARLLNSLLSVAKYIWLTLWPKGLAIFYPHYFTYPGGHLDGGPLIFAIATLLGLTVLALLIWRRSRTVAFGLAGYGVMLLPVIGIVQVGRQALADRYTYLPSIGILSAIAGVACLFTDNRIGRAIIASLGTATLLACIIVTRHQIGYWQTPTAMWTHAIETVPDNYLAHASLGRAFDDARDAQRAEVEYREALRINPAEPLALYNLALMQQSRGKAAAAEALYRRAIAADPSDVSSYNNLANLLADDGNTQEALRFYRIGVAQDDENSPKIYHNYALTLASTGAIRDAIPWWRKAIAIDPNYVEAHFRLGQALIALNQRDPGRAELELAARLAPQREDIRKALSNLDVPPTPAAK